jgi:hypothetical protein
MFRSLSLAPVFGVTGAAPDRRVYSASPGGILNERIKASRAIAAALARVVPPGERALLLYPPGLEVIAAFFGCLYAGVIAVPA